MSNLTEPVGPEILPFIIETVNNSTMFDGVLFKLLTSLDPEIQNSNVGQLKVVNTFHDKTKKM